MPIRVPDNLPATAILEEELVFVMYEGRAYRQDIRPTGWPPHLRFSAARPVCFRWTITMKTNKH